MSLGAYLVGAAAFAITLVACAAAAVRFADAREERLDGLWRGLGIGVATLVAVHTCHLVPGILGVLSRESVLIVALLLYAASRRLPRGAAAVPGGGRDAPRLAAPHVAAAILALFLAAALLKTLGRPQTFIDASVVYLPTAGEWIRSGSLWGLHEWFPGAVHSTYPGSGTLFTLWLMLPWRADFLVALQAYPFVALLVAGVTAAAREVAPDDATATTAALVIVAMPFVFLPAALFGMVDTVLYGTLAAGLAFALRHVRTGAAGDLWLAAGALGLALGSKWYAVTAVPLLFAAWFALLVRRRGLARAFAPVAAAGAVALAIGGFWYLRNATGTGNPLFPQQLGPLDGVVGPFERVFGWSIADYGFDLRLWVDAFVPALWKSLGPGLPLLVVVAAAAAWRGRRGVPAVLVAAALAVAVFYAVTPYSAFGVRGDPSLAYVSTRYLVPALVLAAVVVAAGLPAGRSRLAFRWLGVVAVAVGCLMALRLAYPKVSPLTAFPLVVWTGAVSVVAAAAAAYVIGPRLWRTQRRAMTATVGVAAAIALLAVGAWWERSGYDAIDPVLARVSQAPAGQRVGIAGDVGSQGMSGVWAAFGRRAGNHVRFVGTERDEILSPPADAAALARAVARGRYDLVLVQRARPDVPEPEERWAREAGLTAVASSPRFTLLRAR